MSWKSKGLILFGFLLSSTLLYLPVLEGDWVFDDVRLVSSNDWLWRDYAGPVDELQDWVALFSADDSAFDEVRVGFRPIRFISYRIDVLHARIWGVDQPNQSGSTIAFHLQNVLLHGVAAALLFFLILNIFPAGGWKMSLTLATIFLVHPVQTEAVAWISGRRDVLFGVLYLAALLVSVAGEKQPGLIRGILVALLGAMAMLTKEMAATLPALLIAVSYMASADSRKSVNWSGRLAVLLPCTAVILFLSWRVLTVQDPGAGAEYWGGSFATAMWTMGRAIVSYFGLFLWPVGLSVDHSYASFLASTGPFTPWTTMVSWVLVLLGIGCCWRAFRNGSRRLALSLPLFIVMLSPVLQIFPHPERFAERFMYLPMIALLIAVAGFLLSIERKMPGSRSPATVILLVLMILLTRGRLDDWQGPYPLWSSAVEAQPECARAWFGLAEAARARGWNSQAVSDLGKTISILSEVERDRLQQGYYLQALQIRSGLLASIGGEGNLRSAEGQLLLLLEENDTDGSPVSDQEVPWRELLKIRERLGDAEGARSAALKLLGVEELRNETRLEALLYLAATSEADERKRYNESARQVANDLGGRANARVSYQEGMLALEEERYEQALELFDEALKGLDEAGRKSSARYRKAESLLKLGRAGAARTQLEILLEKDPGHLPSHLSLGELLLAGGDIDLALDHFKTVLAAVPDNAQALQGVQQALVRQRIESGDVSENPLDPTRVTALTMLADRLMARGEPAKAREALLEAQKHAEGPAEAERRLELWLRLARHDASQGEWELAKEGYERLLDRIPVEDRGEFILEFVEVVRRIDGVGSALELLINQYDLGVYEDRIYRQMGAMSHQEGLFLQAAKWYRKHLEEIKDQDPLVRARIETALQQVLKEAELEAGEGTDP